MRRYSQKDRHPVRTDDVVWRKRGVSSFKSAEGAESAAMQIGVKGVGGEGEMHNRKRGRRGGGCGFVQKWEGE